MSDTYQCGLDPSGVDRCALQDAFARLSFFSVSVERAELLPACFYWMLIQASRQHVWDS